MPPKGDRLTDEQVAKLRAWIDAGAPWPEQLSTLNTNISQPSGAHWAFKAPQRVEPPKIKDKKRVRNPIDAFVLARLEKEKIKPSPEADRVTLIRRLNLDLLGLLPTPEEVVAFVSDKRPDAYEQLVDRFAGLAALRRALGTALARSRALRGQRWLREGQSAALRVPLP
jgi:hypothetical protein